MHRLRQFGWALAAHVLRNYALEAIDDSEPAQVGFTATVIPGGVRVRRL